MKKDAHFHVSPNAPTVIKQKHSSDLHYLFIGKKYLDIMALGNFLAAFYAGPIFSFTNVSLETTTAFGGAGTVIKTVFTY